MLISHPPLDSTFSNPVDSLFLPYSSTDDSCFPPPPGQQGWLTANPSAQDDHLRTSPDDFGTSEPPPPPPSPLERLLQKPEPVVRQEDDFRTTDPSKDYPDSRVYRTADPSKEYPDSRTTDPSKDYPDRQAYRTVNLSKDYLESCVSSITNSYKDYPDSRVSRTTDPCKDYLESCVSRTTDPCKDYPDSRVSRTTDPCKDYPDSRVSRTTDPCKDYPDSRFSRTSEDHLTLQEGVLLHQLRDCLQKDKQRRKPKAELINKLLPAEVMSVVDPEDDLKCLVENERKLELCGYYYGSLSWLDASHLLRQCRVGTFLVRDSEHGSYLYTLSVQTRKGPTSCRIEYAGGSFRLDSSKDLSHKMPRFDCVTHLIDFYVRLPRYLPRKNCNKAVWLDMDEENTLDVPVQIYRPLYRQVRSLQHMCRVAIMGEVGDKYGGDPLQGSVLPCKPYRTNPSATLQTALEKDAQYNQLPNIIKEYLGRYPYSQ